MYRAICIVASPASTALIESYKDEGSPRTSVKDGSCVGGCKDQGTHFKTGLEEVAWLIPSIYCMIITV